ncbi:hypothetical protein BP6252_05367 [Coleophoma cylindrospora]|uniref:C2 domain-containing protein n=1 Tax=Coleophoma cylindrospora TaxID=1849047 RepID=A0A3D8RTY9_9HELO|nr:hypothetical protein BP6252_05367 [Coleophoma cylindrospora]
MTENEKQSLPPAANGDPAPDGDTSNGNAEKHHEKLAAAKDKVGGKKEKLKDQPPAGGYDETPLPRGSDGYIVRFTFHRAENLPVADLNTRSSDPFIHATLTSALPKRHKEDPDMTLRTKTIHKNVNPEWNQIWTVAGIPSSGFRLKCRLYDEDPSDHDDRLGNVTVNVGKLGSNWPGIRNEGFDIKKRMGSKRAYMIRGCMSLMSKTHHISGTLFISAEVLGESEPPHGRMYTLGDTFWFKHYSPMIGRIAGTKAPGGIAGKDGKTERYDFQANQFQLQGPVPEKLYHRFVEFKPFVKGMFSAKGLRGRILNKALHHQHNRVYNFSNSTETGVVKPRSEEASLKFLEMVHFDEGGRIFTYVITLDGLFRFTETGKEFGIDLLSKHTMHSNVNIYIACSGEFFVRRLKHPNKPTDAPNQHTHPDEDLPGGPPNDEPPKDPKHYELIIDNDSGTYRPNGKLLSELKNFLNGNFPGLHIVVKECTDEKLTEMKKQQVARKKKEGKNIELVQNSDDEISSSDESDLEAVHSGRRKGTKKQRVYNALEDPKKAAEDLIPGMKGKHEREAREEQEDVATSSAA